MIREERRALRPERSVLKAEASVLQSGRSILPRVGVSIEEFTDGCYRLCEAMEKAQVGMMGWKTAHETRSTGPR